ncbi:hypothetical protein GCK72_019581 [Caenorhabditis remanei]|uniref:Uncharacterized protein n=1 Tax=Caenorhabditis remanei TaxID=31234 RepID=A0A6A5GEB7_CAERE|nr:hypothetical protein GCK72_019581 [Caenorhabditis remanei]KAF1753025.1 hypothetical protein GCK72_019581 [Caenorhabditis remanei]
MAADKSLQVVRSLEHEHFLDLGDEDTKARENDSVRVDGILRQTELFTPVDLLGTTTLEYSKITNAAFSVTSNMAMNKTESKTRLKSVAKTNNGALRMTSVETPTYFNTPNGYPEKVGNSKKGEVRTLTPRSRMTLQKSRLNMLHFTDFIESGVLYKIQYTPRM